MHTIKFVPVAIKDAETLILHRLKYRTMFLLGDGSACLLPVVCIASYVHW
jgi:hypothetical protein